jgi:hypothetical protein
MEMVIIIMDVVAPMCVMAHWGVVARLDVVTAMAHWDVVALSDGMA